MKMTVLAERSAICYDSNRAEVESLYRHSNFTLG
jgi:hypothetical protein